MLNVPESNATVEVSIISPNRVLGVPASAFLTPDVPGTTYSDTPCLCFLIEHWNNGRSNRMLFDLGIRKDLDSSPPLVTEAVRNMDVIIDTPQDMSQILADRGLTPFDIDAIILSHAHFDHIGDLGAFPSTTRLIVGPGFQKEFLPGYPVDPDSIILQESIEGRNIQEVGFINATLDIHGLRALDLFEDGSFYLLDTPGHEVGHISALARTTSKTPAEGSSSFMLLAGDVCHHSGALRPSPQIPLPVTMGSNSSTGKLEGEHLAKMLRRCGAGVKPFYQPSPGGFNRDARQMSATIRSVQFFDADPQCFVVLAHDRWLLDVIDLFPESANRWRELGWADRCRWDFLNDFELNND